MDWSKFVGRRMVLAFIAILLAVFQNQIGLSNEELQRIVEVVLGTTLAITAKDTIVLFKKPAEPVQTTTEGGVK